MPRLSDARLVVMALRALEGILLRCERQPIERTEELRLVLALLFSRSRVRPDKWPYDAFWRAVVMPKRTDRWAAASAALNAIYVSVGEKRTTARMGAGERQIEPTE
jgi:hypothetical protein